MHDDQDEDKMNTLAFINFFTCQKFANPDHDSSIFSVKILCHTALLHLLSTILITRYGMNCLYEL